MCRSQRNVLLVLLRGVASNLTAHEIERDRLLDIELTNFENRYPDIDFSARDATGITLEGRIIGFMLDTGNYCFASAFNIYMKENAALPVGCEKRRGIPRGR